MCVSDILIPEWLKMDFIHKGVELVVKNLDPNLGYTESNLQRALMHYLSKSGFVQSEVCVPYNFIDEGVEIYCGIGRMDLVYTPFKEKTKYILELKKSDKRMHPETFFPQVRRYVKHFKTNFKKVGVLIVFNPTQIYCVK